MFVSPIYLQQLTSNALGNKDALSRLGNETEYRKVHHKFHQHIKDYQARFGYYDIFLVDIQSKNVVYSVFKELDFATSLVDGPFSASGFGIAYKEASQLYNPSDTIITNFKPYAPSYQDIASFIASPTFKDGEKIGILIFQMPINIISSVMAHNNKWKEVGLGDSGETYLNRQ